MILSPQCLVANAIPSITKWHFNWNCHFSCKTLVRKRKCNFL